MKQKVRIRFALGNGMECVIDEHGIVRVPGLDAPPGFNLEEEFARAARFVLENTRGHSREKAPARPRTLTQAELETLAVEAGRATAEFE